VVRINRQRLKAIVRKEFIHVFRDWRSLGIAIAIPVLLILLFGYALDMDLENVPTVVYDQSRTPESRDLISMLDGSPYIAVDRYTDNYRDIETLLDTGTMMVAIVIPYDFADSVRGNRDTSVQVIADGSDANTARLALGYMTALGLLYNQEINIERAEMMGAGSMVVPVASEPRAFYNADLRSQNILIPGIVAIVMIVIAAMLTSVTVAKEWELGTMEQLISTPVRAPELMLGKIAPYFVIGMIDVTIAVVMGQWVFGVPLRGSPALVFLSASIFLIGALFFGLMLSIILKKQVLSNQAALLGSYLPTMLLSGFVFAIQNMPEWVQYITYIVPGRYFIALLRGIYLKGIGLEILWMNLLFLVIYATIMVVNARRMLVLKLEQ